MKNPLHYQISEYDCGPTSMLNAIIYLFDRDEIPPEVIRNTMLYCLDCYSKEGIPGKRGTSRAAMMFLSNWLNEFGNLGMMTVSSEYLSGSEVYIVSVNFCIPQLIKWKPHHFPAACESQNFLICGKLTGCTVQNCEKLLFLQRFQ